jgi:predicted aspartyl protease
MLSLTRRQTAATLLGAAGATLLPASFAHSQEAPVVAEVVEDHPPTQVQTAAGRNEHMILPVSINGQGPFRFMIDTGANVSCVSQKLAEQLSLEAASPARVHTVVGVRSRPRVTISHLEIGGRVRRTVRAPALSFRGTDIDGLLGVDWLKGQRLVLDFKRQNLEITRSRTEHPEEGRVIVPARRRSGQLTIVDADMRGKRISAMIDSGSQVTVCNAALRRLVEKEQPGEMGEALQRVRLEAITGETFWGDMLYLPFVRLGGLQLGNVPVVHADLHVFDLWDLNTSPALVIGMDLLTQFNAVALDYGRSVVRFDISEASPAIA